MNDFALEHAKGKQLTESGIIINSSTSIAINGILNKLANESAKSSRPLYDVYVINILTVIRNCYKKDNTDKSWLQACDADINALKTYISAYCQGGSNKPIVIFYIPTYIIPDGHARKLSPMQIKIANLAIQIEKMMPKKYIDISTAQIPMYYICLERVPLPIIQITQYIRKLSNVGTKASILMFSHCPLDLHLSRMIPNTSIIESYTAEIKSKDMFGMKVFKDKNIPFNKYTHIAFGDSSQLATLIKTRTHKEAAFDAAAVNNWRIKTEREILHELIRLGIPEVHLTKLKLY